MRTIPALPRLLLPPLFICLTACFSRPEGPAERIGRSIDEIADALDDIDRSRQPARRDPRAPAPGYDSPYDGPDDSSASDYRYDDPGYDEPTREREEEDSARRRRQNSDWNSRDDEWSSERRY